MNNRPSRYIGPLGPPKSSPRQRVLATWRGIDLLPLERARLAPAKPIRDIVPNILNKLGLERRLAERAILKVWNDSMDPNIAAHACPTGLRNGTLFVAVDNSVWLSEIVRYRRREILDRLQHSFGLELIRKISFRIG